MVVLVGWVNMSNIPIYISLIYHNHHNPSNKHSVFLSVLKDKLKYLLVKSNASQIVESLPVNNILTDIKQKVFLYSILVNSYRSFCEPVS